MDNQTFSTAPKPLPLHAGLAYSWLSITLIYHLLVHCFSPLAQVHGLWHASGNQMLLCTVVQILARQQRNACNDERLSQHRLV